MCVRRGIHRPLIVLDAGLKRAPQVYHIGFWNFDWWQILASQLGVQQLAQTFFIPIFEIRRVELA